MKIHRISGTFGRLQQDTLTLQDGLNIIHAPNEAGKSTWSALLTAMLYGVNSRERDRTGAIAEKNRYAPWGGAAMSGRLDCCQGGTDLTILRETRRPAAPMADFSAVYAGTGDPVPGLTGLNCGETLLGVTREVWERSAFIRQGGLAVIQDAGLERRIAALISSGEENTSYTEALAALKKQLHLRRHNKTGQLPALEAQLQDLNRQLAETEQLTTQLTQTREQIRTLEAQEQALARQAALQERQAALESLEDARCVLAEAEERADRMDRRIREQRIPETDAIGRLRGAIVNLGTARKAVDKAREDRDAAMKALLRAEAAVQESPFAGQSVESARREASGTPNVHPSPVPALLTTLCIAAAAAGAAWLLQSRGPVLFWGILGGGLLLAALCGWGVLRASRQKARTAALLKRFGTTVPAEITALLDEYARLCQTRDDAQAEADRAAATADALAENLTTNEQSILLEVRRFAPASFDLSAADSALRSAFSVRKALSEAQAAVREARARCEFLEQQAPDTGSPPLSISPETGREVSRQLEETRARLASARSAGDRLSGRLQALGDPSHLRAQIQQLTSKKETLEQEYAAIALAMEALTAANTDLQSRFSPALGRRAAEIFSRLTDGRYDGVTLDRAFRLTAEPAGDPIPRDAGLLSAGAGDQLYLAVRLAICDLVLPGEDPAPIVLDDALVNFDDDRCAATLTYLKELARQRQILLFTCHRREADFFREDPAVSVQSLSFPG